MKTLWVVFLIALVFLPLERVFTLHRRRILRRDWFNDLIYWVVNGHLVGVALALTTGGFAVAGHWFLSENLHAVVASQPYWLQFVEALFLSDLGFYVTHRAFHASPTLWKIHSIHHSIEELDWLAAARVHPLDQILTKAVSLLPVFVLGFSGGVVAAILVLYTWQSVLVHSNVRIKFGPLRWVLASPEFHHWHHSNDLEARDRNFAGQLPILDVLFGTLHMPKGKRPTAYGIDTPMVQNYALQLAYPFRREAVAVARGDAEEEASTPVRAAVAQSSRVRG